MQKSHLTLTKDTDTHMDINTDSGCDRLCFYNTTRYANNMKGYLGKGRQDARDDDSYTCNSEKSD
jgi:hypothetical protein